MKKVLCLAAMIMTIFILHVSVYADTSLSFVTDETLPDAVINTYYSTKLEASGGQAPYTFKIADKLFLPSGMTLSEDGVLSGTPSVGGVTYCNIKAIVTDTAGNTAEKVFSLYISAKKVTFKILQNTFTYDAQPHTVTAVPYVDGIDASALITDFDITYNGKSSQTNAGNYPIKISVNTPGYVFDSMDQKRMYIEQNPNTNISFTNTVFSYDGNAKSPDVSVTGRYTEDSNVMNLPYTVLYEGINGTDYSSDEPPYLPGQYRLSCKISNTNFATPENNSVTFEITPNTVNFTLNDTSDFYCVDIWNRTYQPSVSSVTDYTVKYVKNAVEYDAPAELGVYTVKITFNDSSLYTVGEISPSTVTVKKKPVNFTVTRNPQEYTGEELYPVITNDCGLSENTDYIIEYYKDENKTVPKDAGEYKIVINILNDKYVLGSQSADVFKIYEADEKAEITLGDGNSIFAQINNAGGDTEGAKQSFTNTYTYNGKYYSPKAWSDENLDTDEKALFMYNGTETVLPSVNAVDYGGGTAQVKTVLETEKGDIDLTGKTTYIPDDIPCGIYTIKYTILGDTSDNPVTETRKAVVLWQLGDANFDKHVNSIDGNYIFSTYAAMAESTPNEKLFKYRMCDVNKDGVVNVLDRDAVYSRMVTPIAEYYR
ncbi:MAG: putative Ig domain-containing protein [Hominilimicola sp.]